ncbi:MAG: hypothetical protein P4L55_20095 [Syntrophobacteraceae bacterium]|nr:hypothetical protein [Syntrophobacteraceae bacterium]
MKKVCLGCVFAIFALVTALTIVPAARAGSGNPISMNLSGPITAHPSASISLTINPTNNLQPTFNSDGSTKQNSITWGTVQSIIINPWTGQVVSGPNTTTVISKDQVVKSWFFNSSGSPTGATILIPFQISMGLPKIKAGQSLVVMVYAMDSSSKVIGTAFWGFAAK